MTERDLGLRLPEFIIGGAPRAGTTWLYHLLDAHPQVRMARPVRPEPKFFLVDDLYRRGLPHYARTWFEGIPPGLLAGEKSANYLESAAAARRIARDLPAVRVVFILREPAERAWSNYLWSKLNGMETESFEQALAREEEREATYPPTLRFARPHSYFSRGLYADLLTPYLNELGQDRVLCLRYEDLVADPEALAIQLHRFLVIQERPGDAARPGVVNPTEGESPPADAIARLRARYQDANRRLAQLLGPDFVVWEET